jgi:hypothetical protein
MKVSSSLGAIVACSLLSVGSAFAAGMSQMSEPSNGFTKGQNPEWGAAHAYAKQSNPDHRSYHKNAEAELALWLRQHADSKGTVAYENMKRSFLRQRNMLHRQWHLGDTENTAMDKMDSMPELTIFSTTVEITIVPTPSDVMLSHTFSGTAPSRRSIVEMTENMQKLHALTVGRP